VARHPQNGPTFSKTPQKKRGIMTDAERAAWQARKDAEQEEMKRTAAQTRSFNQLLRNDRKAALRQLGFAIAPDTPIKRRKI
jgi:hypothetical protein